MREFIYFILGLLLAIPIAVMSPFMTVRVQKRFATRSEKQAKERTQLIEREYAEAKDYRDDPIKLLRLVTTRILWLTIFWVGQNIVDVIFGFVANSSYLASQVNQTGPFVRLNFNEVASLANVMASLVDMLILTYIFRSGLRVYRIVKRVTNFEKYEASALGELALLRRVEEYPEASLTPATAILPDLSSSERE